jgi:prolyl oligopeptidase
MRFGFALLGAGVMMSAQIPATPKRPVTDTYHGVKVTDDYRWLEDWNDPVVKAWSDAQNRYARQFLDGLPSRAGIYANLEKLYRQQSASYGSLTRRGNGLFAMKRQPPKEQPLLVLLNSAGSADGDAARSERVVVDPTAIDASGHTAIDFYVPSVDGKLVAVSMSQGGSESGDVHVFDISGNSASGKALPDVIAHVNGGTAGGSLAWTADGKGLYYTRYPRTGERAAADMDFYQQIWFHTLGTKPESDTYALGKNFPRIAEIAMAQSEDGRWVVAHVSNGDGGEISHYLLGPTDSKPGKPWVQVARFSDDITDAVFGVDGYLYLLSRNGAPMRKVVRVPLSDPNLANAQVVVPESKVVIEEILPTAKYLYVSDMVGGPSDVRVFSLAGEAKGGVALPPVSSVGEMVREGADGLLFRSVSYLEPAGWSRYEPGSGRVVKTALVEKSAAEFGDAEVVREFATSKDGTKVPLNIIRKRGLKLDGSHPVLLYGYGGYSINLTPAFSVRVRPLLDAGFVYVVANLRGGGEFGEQWHEAGMLAKKQNVFDDFAASAKWLVESGYTSPARLAIEGGSNGGLLMGAAVTQHPELYRAVVTHVGIYDMLRVELSPNGAFNVTEFGTVKEGNLFEALFAYSPYHHVKDGVEYPAVMFMTGANDPRVDPANSRKMTARLQASGSKRPVLLRTSSNAGHGIGSSLTERLNEEADVEAFLFRELGIGK